jgi:hypothetical protein
MRAVLFLFFICFVFNCNAQDDNPDYRPKKDNLSRVQEKDIQNDLTSFTLAGVDQSMGKLMPQSLSVTGYSDKGISFGGDDLAGNKIAVTITAGVFFPTKHKLMQMDKFLARIDNKGYFGNYGKVPSVSIGSVTLLINNDTIAIPADAYSDLYNPSFYYKDQSGNIKSHDNVYLSADKRTIYIYMLNPDNMGGYEVTWVIQDKKYLRRVVDFNITK